MHAVRLSRRHAHAATPSLPTKQAGTATNPPAFWLLLHQLHPLQPAGLAESGCPSLDKNDAWQHTITRAASCCQQLQSSVAPNPPLRRLLHSTHLQCMHSGMTTPQLPLLLLSALVLPDRLVGLGLGGGLCARSRGCCGLEQGGGHTSRGWRAGRGLAALATSRRPAWCSSVHAAASTVQV